MQQNHFLQQNRALVYFGKSRGGQWGQFVFKQTRAWIAGLLLFGFMVPNINNWGHGGGLFAGLILALIMGYEEKRKQSFVDRILSISLAMVTLFFLVRTVGQGIILVFPDLFTPGT
ncbi:MAG: hypothetical protein HUK40_20185 [Desulfobacter sp.]|nr:hypothetical protein [Desulfobacter sp.]